MKLRKVSGHPFARTLVPLCKGSLLALVVLALAVPAAFARQCGDYTQVQAQRGAGVYDAHCAACHGAHLEGQAGPALAGRAFKESLEFSKMSATQLFNFISTQMPRTDPGSLEKQQYEDVMAFILSKNGYPVGTAPLNPNSLKHTKLLPYPEKTQSSQKSTQATGARAACG